MCFPPHLYPNQIPSFLRFFPRFLCSFSLFPLFSNPFPKFRSISLPQFLSLGIQFLSLSIHFISQIHQFRTPSPLSLSKTPKKTSKKCPRILDRWFSLRKTKSFDNFGNLVDLDVDFSSFKSADHGASKAAASVHVDEAAVWGLSPVFFSGRRKSGTGTGGDRR